jgi:hypothetical protein
MPVPLPRQRVRAIRTKVRRVEHHAALPYAEMGEFIGSAG